MKPPEPTLAQLQQYLQDLQQTVDLWHSLTDTEQALRKLQGEHLSTVTLDHYHRQIVSLEQIIAGW